LNKLAHSSVVELQAETSTAAIPELDYDMLATELEKKSPLEIMDHVGLLALLLCKSSPAPLT
jgi:hypothetical protein